MKVAFTRQGARKEKSLEHGLQEGNSPLNLTVIAPFSQSTVRSEPAVWHRGLCEGSPGRPLSLPKIGL